MSQLNEGANNMNLRSSIPIGVSNRHLHISKQDLELLFGKGYELTFFKPLSTPGQFACKEIVTLKGPKGSIEGVRILGPVRKDTQVEVLQSDSFKLGLDVPSKESGDIDGTPGITIVGGNGEIDIAKGVIVALRHIHMSPEDAIKCNVKDKDIVDVKVNTKRGVVFNNTVIRVDSSFKLEMHIDFDEANACLAKTGDLAEIL